MMRTIGAALGVLLVCHSGASAQVGGVQDTVVLTLRDAIVRSTRMSEEVRLAQSQVELAGAQVRTVRADALPQLSGVLGYTRTFESQFNTGGSFTIPDSLRFEPDSLAPLTERVSYLEQRVPTAGLAGLGSLFGDLPFGRENGYTAFVNGTQTLFSPSLRSALDAARQFREAAELNLAEQLADIELSVRRAYHQALLATELEQISAAALEQAEKFLTQERLREKSGAGSELDVLRAEVAAANLRPQLIAAQNAAQLALLDMRRLVNVPATQPVRLVTTLEVPAAEHMAELPADSVALLQTRPAIAAAERAVRMRELGVRIAKSAYLPSASVSVSYGRITYPISAFDFTGNEWRTDFSATVSVNVPIFNGLRREANIDQAQVELRRAALQLAQLRENVQLQYEQAAGERRRAAAAIAARQQTVTQAQRVYDLTVLRYDRGLATQLEVSDARLALLQARTNLAQALTDFYIAEATVRRALGRTEVVE